MASKRAAPVRKASPVQQAVIAMLGDDNGETDNSDLYTMTVKQALFVLHYCDTLDGIKAAIAAGYSARTAYAIASENLRKPEIANAISRRISSRHMTKDEVVTRLAEHARTSLGDFITVHARLPFIDLEKAEAANKLHLIKKLRTTKQGIEIELHDAQAALVQLGRVHGMFNDKLDIRLEANVNVALVNDAIRAIQQLGLDPVDVFNDLIAAAHERASIDANASPD